MNCLSIAFESVNKCIEVAQGFEMVEFRLDMINYENRIDELFSVKAKKIVTYRPKAGINDDIRMKACQAAIDAGADYIDIELENSESYKNELIAYARKKGTKIIISYHSYDRTPPLRELEQIIDWSAEYNPKIIKIACMVNDKKDVARLLSLYDTDFSLIVLGMGELGKLTRIASVLLGAPFTFVSYDKDNSTASGQFSFEQLEDILKRIALS